MLLASLAGAGSAYADPKIGPSSSASLEISVSVAARHALREAGGPSPSDNFKRAGSFCIETNDQMLLPVMLVRPQARDGSASEPQATDETVALPPCGTAERMTTAPVADVQRTSGLLIVRPD